MVCSRMVVLPRGISCFGLPIRFDSPAARSITDIKEGITSLTSPLAVSSDKWETADSGSLASGTSLDSAKRPWAFPIGGSVLILSANCNSNYKNKQ
ncbi:hypothetical protein ES703_124831 [subsurface metagenome]